MNLTTKFLFFYFLIYICDCCVDDQFNTLYTFDCNKQNKKILSCSSQCVIKNRNTNVNQSSFTFLKDINSIDVLKVEKCVMNFLPNGFNKSLSMIDSLEIIRTQLKEITKENLKQFPKLKKLSVPFNDLTKINDDLLDFNSKIDYIDIRYNKILNFETPKEIAEVLRRANRLIHFSKEGNFVKNDMKLNCKIINERFDEKLKDYDTKWQSKKHKKNLIGKFHDIERKMENFIMSKSADVSSSSESSEQRNENLKVSQFDSNIFIIIGTFINSILIIIVFFLFWKLNIKIKNMSFY